MIKFKETVEELFGMQQTTVNKTGQWRYYAPVRKEKTAPCSAACPLQNNPAQWVEKVKKEDYWQAWQLLARTNPFPAITGHICAHFCEEKCRRGQYDEPVAIGELEKQIGLWRLEHYRPQNKPNHKKALPQRQVAIIGSGPAGLACAYYLAQLDLQPVVFERFSEPGGLLAWGIPGFRLPRQILQTELAILQDLGVKFKTQREVALADYELLRQEFAAVFLATGAGKEKILPIPGAELAGVKGAISYLRSAHLGEIDIQPRHVVVIGGGNTAMDAAMTARRQGAHVTIVYRRTQGQMPAHSSALSAAKAAGVQILEKTEPVEILGSNKVEKVVLWKKKTETIVQECDLLLYAIGQRKGDLPAGLVPIGREGVKTNIPGVYLGGDMRTGPASVAAAIAAGREAAREIADYLQVKQAHIEAIMAPPLGQRPVVNKQCNVYFSMYPKQRRSGEPPQEAARCFSCGHCNQCGLCWLFCPDLAIQSREHNFAILLDYCKGCGICAQECPAGVLEMEEEEDASKNFDR
ncbi:MAG: FAD-dependent oxidoreductase [Firmicutes bacterium]|nr:FAD-dependent oxidoreductase [Bacillota bacterium]